MICVSPSELKIILDIFKKHIPRGEVRAFGSRYKWTCKDYSDLDIAINIGRPMTSEELGAIEEDFIESDLPYRVDVLDYNGISKEFRAVIDKGYEVVYKALGWEKVRLGKLCHFVNKRISVANLNLDTYISTENMLPNKMGIFNSTSLPRVSQVSEYQVGDILVSNIRPYFRKIWFANRNGGCSNDVLIFRANNCDPKFLYYLLSEDTFFDYVTSTSKGTKMPRGDKTAIMQYDVLNISLSTQRNIATILSCMDDKIELNNRINKNLEAQAQAIFKSWFVDFEPFLEGEFEDSELGRIPKGWRVGRLGEIVLDTISGDWGKETKQTNFSEKVVCIRGADLPEIEKGNKGNAPTRFISKKNLDAKKLGEDEIIIEISGGSPTQSTGRCAYISNKLLSSYDVPILCTNFCRALKLNEIEYAPFVYFMLKYLYKESVFFQYENGTTGIKNLDLKSFLTIEKIIVPSKVFVNKFKEIFDRLFISICENSKQNQTLVTIRDTLLPKLMNGELLPVALQNLEDSPRL